MSAIKATNSSNLIIENCSFAGFETDVELENVDGFISKNNQFSKDSNPKLLLTKLSEEIMKSDLDKSSKERLGKQIIKALSSKEDLQKEQGKIKTMLTYAGDKAVDLFVQLAAAVLAGLVIKGP